MNERETAERLRLAARVLEDIADGHDMEYKCYTEDGWLTAPEPNLSSVIAHPERYRRKPKVEEIWVNEYAEGHKSGVHQTEGSAQSNARSDAIHVARRWVPADTLVEDRPHLSYSLKRMEALESALRDPVPNLARTCLAMKLYDAEYIGQDTKPLWVWAWDKAGE